MTATAPIDLTRLHLPVTDEEIQALATPHLEVGRDRVWYWEGQGRVRHTVHTHGTALIEWTVWFAATPLQTTWEVPDEPQEVFVAKLRRSGADALHANQVLTRNGYSRTQHTARPDCTCEDCPTTSHQP